MRSRRQQAIRPTKDAPARFRPEPFGWGTVLAALATLILLLLVAVPLEDSDPGLHPAPLVPRQTAMGQIEAIRQNIAAGDLRWQAGVTGVSHLSPEAFAALLGAVPPPAEDWDVEVAGEASLGTLLPLASGDGSQYLPRRWDWRELQGVTPARYQGGCGGCWAFAAAGAAEGLLRIYDDREIDLSEQQVLDCNTAGYGCDGGWMTAAYRLWREQGALEETLLPYRAEDNGTCPAGSGDPAAHVSGWTAVQSTQTALKHALLVGPVAVGMHVYPDFQHYVGGVYEHAGSETVNHAVVLVGWDDALGAWIIKNSWGETWGEDGFAYVAYGSCRLGSFPHRLQIEARRDLRIHHERLADFCADGRLLEVRAVVAALKAPLDPASVRLVIDRGAGYESLPLEPLTLDSASGVFGTTLPAVPAGTRVRYYIEAADTQGGICRYPEEADLAPLEFHVLRPVYATGFEEATDWTVGDLADDATNGLWELGSPEAAFAEGDLMVQPAGDHTPGGERCFVTGAAAGPGIDGDVDGGATTLLSPELRLGGYEKAVLEFWLWYVNQVGPRPFEDSFLVQATNDGGETWTTVLDTRAGQPEWQLVSIPLHAFLELTDQMRVRFVASDEYSDSMVEAAIDDVRLLAPAPPDEDQPPTPPPAAGSALTLATGANPSHGQTELVFTLATGRHVRAELFDAAGRLVRTLWQGDLPAGTHHIPWNGRGDDGRPVGGGRYLARVIAGADRSTRSLTLLR